MSKVPCRVCTDLDDVSDVCRKCEPAFLAGASAERHRLAYMEDQSADNLQKDLDLINNPFSMTEPLGFTVEELEREIRALRNHADSLRSWKDDPLER